MKKLSFSKLEHKYIHDLREKLNLSENKNDVEKYFSHIAKKFVAKVLNDDDVINNKLIIKLINKTPYYKISNFKYIKNNPEYYEIWQNSDLKDIIKRFAETAYKRYLHIAKNVIKSKLKIRR